MSRAVTFQLCPSFPLQRPPPLSNSIPSCLPQPTRRIPQANLSSSTPPPRRLLRPKQSLSQNFLRDRRIINRIVATFSESRARLSPHARVVEVGPGLGAITEPLLDIYPDMHAIEIDQRAVSHLKEHYPQLDVRHADVLDTNWGLLSDEVRAPLAVIGNLPYNVVSQILFSLLEARRGCIGLAVVMMQKEVADRIVAPTKCKAYGILSVVAQLYSRPKLLFPVPNTAFFPKPDVTSAMVEFEFVPNSHFDVTDLALAATLRNVLRTAFNQRRKVLRNSLRPICDEIGKELPDSFGKKRAEEISPTDFIRLTRFLYGEQMKSGLWNENDRTSVWR